MESYVKVMEFGCPDRLSPGTGIGRIHYFLCCLNFGCTDGIPALDYLVQPDVNMNIWPDLLITVNFTTLGINATSTYRSRTVSIVVGMHDDTVDILRNTLPIPLVPDAHLLGGVLMNIRYEYRSPKLASLGAFSSVRPSVYTSFTHILIMTHQTKKYLTSSVPFLTPDPLLNIPRDDNTATLRLYIQPDPTDWHVSIDYREKSILAGISALGGFWTVANGIFAIIFGTTLWWFLLGEGLDLPYSRGVLTRTSGIKPLSAFGLIHKIPKFRPVLEDERQHGRYPNLLSDGQSDGGLLDYVHDHFIDLGPFENNRAGSATSDSEK